MKEAVPADETVTGEAEYVNKGDYGVECIHMERSDIVYKEV